MGNIEKGIYKLNPVDIKLLPCQLWKIEGGPEPLPDLIHQRPLGYGDIIMVRHFRQIDYTSLRFSASVISM